MVFRWTGSAEHRASATAYAEAGEQTLVKGLRQGDGDAFAALYSLHHARIFNYVARIMGNPDDAGDVTQEVFLKAFRQIPGDGRELALKPWLYRVATTTCLDHLRSRNRRGETCSTSEMDLPALGDAYEQRELNGLVQEALDELSDRHRLVLVLKDLHGLKHDEIAEILETSRGATETLLFRARAAFKRAFLAAHEDNADRKSCPDTRRSALAFINQTTPAEERKRVLDHARSCRDCRKVVRRTRSTIPNLLVALPALVATKLLHGRALAADIAASLGNGGASRSGGLLAQIGDAAAAKVAVVATAATVAIAGAGITTTDLRREPPAGPGGEPRVSLVTDQGTSDDGVLKVRRASSDGDPDTTTAPSHSGTADAGTELDGDLQSSPAPTSVPTTDPGAVADETDTGTTADDAEAPSDAAAPVDTGSAVDPQATNGDDLDASASGSDDAHDGGDPDLAAQGAATKEADGEDAAAGTAQADSAPAHGAAARQGTARPDHTSASARDGDHRNGGRSATGAVASRATHGDQKSR